MVDSVREEEGWKMYRMIDNEQVIRDGRVAEGSVKALLVLGLYVGRVKGWYRKSGYV